MNGCGITLETEGGQYLEDMRRNCFIYTFELSDNKISPEFMD